MVSIHLEHIIAKKNGKILKNMVSRAKKTSFFNVFRRLLKTRFSRYQFFLKCFFSANIAFIDEIFSRDESK